MSLDDPNGHGVDLDCLFDLQPDFRLISGRPMLAQALIGRIITPRGGLIDDPDYGTDIADMLNDDMSPAQIASVNSSIEAEWQKDERVIDAAVTGSFALGTLTVVGIITDQQGPFSLTLAINQVDVTLLAVSQ